MEKDNDSFLVAASFLFLSVLIGSSICVGSNYKSISNRINGLFNRPQISALYQYAVQTNQRRYVDSLLDEVEGFAKAGRPLRMQYLRQAEAYGEAFDYPVDRRIEKIMKGHLGDF